MEQESKANKRHQRGAIAIRVNKYDGIIERLTQDFEDTSSGAIGLAAEL